MLPGETAPWYRSRRRRAIAQRERRAETASYPRQSDYARLSRNRFHARDRAQVDARSPSKLDLKTSAGRHR